MRSRYEEGFDEYVELSHRIDAERSAAKSIVEGIRRHLPLLPAVIPDSWRTMAVVQELRVLADERGSHGGGRSRMRALWFR